MKGTVHMAIRIDTFDLITFEIPDGKGKIVEITVPPVDCLDPQDVRKLNAGLAAIPEEKDADGYLEDHENPNKSPAELTRFMLAYYNPTKAKRDAIAGLVPRQLSQISEAWNGASEISVGESEPSTTGSSDDVE